MIPAIGQEFKTTDGGGPYTVIAHVPGGVLAYLSRFTRRGPVSRCAEELIAELPKAKATPGVVYRDSRSCFYYVGLENGRLGRSGDLAHDRNDIYFDPTCHTVVNRKD